MRLSGLALAGLEAALNRLLGLDPQARPQLASLQGRVVALEILGLSTTLYLAPGPAGVQLLSRLEAPADCTISGTPLALARLGASRNQAGELFTGGVQLSGDTELGQAFGKILADLDIDWEEQLARLSGDVIAHQLGRGLRGLLGWTRQVRDTLGQDIQEYLQEELQLLPARGEVELFHEAVDVLRDDVERLEARLARLEAQGARARRETPVIGPAQALRLIHINWVLMRHGLDEVVLATHLFRPVRFLKYFSPWYWLREPAPYGVRIRRALEDLGPLFVKFGQILSTRRDLLPDEIANELAKLQDRVPPFPGAQARAIIEKAYGRPIEAVLEGFDERPLASASIAQVHSASLKDGTAVVVKVLRPGIEKTIRRDVGLLFTIAHLAERYWKEGRRLRPMEVVREYEQTILDELDLMREAANASQLRRNFLGSPALYIPEVYWDYTRPSMLVMERISGTPVGDVAALRRQGISMRMLGERGVEIFFTQVFRDNFFHADMHPGNIFVAPDGQYIAVDFGIIGTLMPEDQRYLAENLLAFFNRDYRRVAELHLESEWVPKGTRVDEFESAIRTVCEPIFEKPISQISFGHFLLRLFQTARRFQMEVQPQLVLLQKTLLNIEGLGRQLYPELDLWKTAKPFLERWMSEQVGTRAFVKRVRRTLPRLSESIPEIPELAHRVLSDATRGRLQVSWQPQDLAQLRAEIHHSGRRTALMVAGGSLLISGVLLVTLGPSTGLLSGALPGGLFSLGVGLGGAGLAALILPWLNKGL